jgi:hypothetical protein
MSDADASLAIYSPEAKAASCLHKGHDSDKLTRNVTDVGHMLDKCAKRCPSEFTDNDAMTVLTV